MATKKSCGCGSKSRKSDDNKRESGPVCKKDADMMQMRADRFSRQEPVQMNYRSSVPPQREACSVNQVDGKEDPKCARDRKRLSAELEERKRRVSQELDSINMELKKLQNPGKM